MIDLVVVEVAGRDDYEKLRRCAYHKMDVVIFCYATDNPASLERVQRIWLPELQKYAPSVPYILVGTKKDIRESYIYELESLQVDDTTKSKESISNSVVTTSHGSEVAKSIGARAFLECSALYRDATREVFETAAQVALKTRRKRKSH